ncbi:MAG: hypothetical protein Q8P81_03775, partial [Nanoarchaeota archaeon]|nr:hypothetical protein [Nanoarchaeota archaeon]
MDKEEVNIDISKLKKTIWRNKYTSGFSALALFFLLTSVIVYFQIGLGGSMLVQFIYSIPPILWLLLALSFSLSTLAAYYEKYNLMFLPILIWLLLATGVVRTQNMSGLRDVTTGDWILGPDLDPFLYLRHAIEISEGTLQNPDTMRSAPLGSRNYAYSNMMPWAIFFIYKGVSLFTETSVTYAAIIAPVIFSIIASTLFFCFIYILFSFRFSKNQSGLAATIATTFYIFSAPMLHRTTGGIPEIESLGMVWFWATFLFFTLAWKQENIRKRVLFGVLAGLFTGAMTWTWGGVKYIYMALALISFVAFLFRIEPRKNFHIFLSWALTSLLIEFIGTRSLSPILFSLEDTGFTSGVLMVLIVDWITNKKMVRDRLKIKILNFSRSVRSIIITGLLAVISLLIINPSFLKGIFLRVVEGLLYPFGKSRVGLTVAENAAPYFLEVFDTFGYLFWAFLLGAIIVFHEATKHFDNSKSEKMFFAGIIIISILSFSYINYVLIDPGNGSKDTFYDSPQIVKNVISLIYLTLIISLTATIFSFIKKKEFSLLNYSFLFFIVSFIFSRISSESILNGEGVLSRILYLGGFALFIICVSYTYLRACVKKDERLISDFSNIKFPYLLILSFSFLAIVSMRGAVRLFFIIAPMLIIVVTYLIIRFPDYISRQRDGFSKFSLGLFFTILLIFVTTAFASQATSTVQAAESTIHSSYNQQWQKAMSWVRENTPENSIFVHWWDYGYWVQTIGERPTLTDGGHPSFAFTYESARYILTTPKPETALSMMKSLNISYLLIDSTDFGKYPAYSRIGSNESWDRFSVLSPLVLDRSQSRDIENGSIKVYQGVVGVDQDLVYEKNGETIFLPGPTYDETGNPSYKSFMIGAVMESSKIGTATSMVRPDAVFFYNGNQYKIPVRYVYYEGQLLDFNSGL